MVFRTDSHRLPLGFVWLVIISLAAVTWRGFSQTWGLQTFPSCDFQPPPPKPGAPLIYLMDGRQKTGHNQRKWAREVCLTKKTLLSKLLFEMPVLEGKCVAEGEITWGSFAYASLPTSFIITSGDKGNTLQYTLLQKSLPHDAGLQGDSLNGLTLNERATWHRFPGWRDLAL